MTDDDRELLMLAAQVKSCAESARNIVLNARTQAHVARHQTLESAKLQERRRMERMLVAWRGLRAEGGAPYRDARMLLVEGILFYATVARRSRTATPSPLSVVDTHHASARSIAALVAQLYPKLSRKMRDADRIDRIGKAIDSAASSGRKPWKAIAATWDGIESGAPNPERWRKDWHEHASRARANRP